MKNEKFCTASEGVRKSHKPAIGAHICTVNGCSAILFHTFSVKVGLCEDVRGQALNFKKSGFKSATLFRSNDLMIL